MITQLIRAGVTKRAIDTLISRGQAPFTVTANVQVFCVHGREKRSVIECAIDPTKEKPHICPCCENMYTRRDDQPGLPCLTCAPKGSRDGDV